MQNNSNDSTTDILNCLSNLSNDEVFTPPEIVNKMLDMLPQTLFQSKDTKFLDPCSKSGVFLREIVKRLNIGLKSKIPNLQKRIDWILKNQVFGIPLTELTYHLTKRSLYCSIHVNGKFCITNAFDKNNKAGNICSKIGQHTFRNKKCIICGFPKEMAESRTEKHAYYFIHCKKPEDIFNMKFDVIIGNPPYQLDDGGGTGSSAIPIYQKFVESALKLNPNYLSMIIPSRWFTGGKGLNEFRSNMINRKDITVLHDFINPRDCFPGVSIEGGVCYFLIDKNYNGKCHIFTHQQDGNIEESKRFLSGGEDYDIFVRDEKVLKIVKKVLSNNFNSFEKIVSTRNPFLIGNSDVEENKKENYLKVLGRFNSQRGYRYISSKKITKGKDLIGKYKLFISKADGAAGQIGNPVPARIIGIPVNADKTDVCTETFLAVGPFNSKEEMLNAGNYMQTKFFRFLVGARKNKNMTQSTYRYVPLLDFRNAFDDKTLYKMFGLSNDEITYIEKMIS